LKVDRPHVIGLLGPQPRRWHRGLAQTLALAARARHPEPLLAPHPTGALDVEHPPGVEQQLVRAAIPPPRPLPRESPQRRSQRRVIADHARLMTLGGAMLTSQPARPTL
jgi:hypothetical protein